MAKCRARKRSRASRRLSPNRFGLRAQRPVALSPHPVALPPHDDTDGAFVPQRSA